MPRHGTQEQREGRRDTYVRSLIEALDNREPMTPVRAAWILGEMRAREAVPELVSSCARHSDDPEFLATAAEALGKIGDDSALPFLADIARTSYLKARLTAVEALGRWLPREEARQALQSALNDPNVIVRRAAEQALSVASGKTRPGPGKAE